MQKTLLAMAILAGLLFGYIESRPNWDDTALLIIGIVGVCGLITLLGYQRPWLVALVVSIWILLHGIFVSHSSGPIVAVVIAFIGAYAGWGVRTGLQKMG